MIETSKSRFIFGVFLRIKTILVKRQPQATWPHGLRSWLHLDRFHLKRTLVNQSDRFDQLLERSQWFVEDLRKPGPSSPIDCSGFCCSFMANKLVLSAALHQCDFFSHRFTRYEIQQDAPLSQRDRAAGYISFGQKWKTGTQRQYFTDIVSLASTTVT